MMNVIPTFLFCLFCALQLAAAVDRPRGVSLEKAHFYRGTEFKCLSDGKAMPLDHINDDYCDCEDGSDEPGTSACSSGLFYCENKAFKGTYIRTSRVNDGVCDCCDGSDEYDGTISCENTCEKLYAEIRAQQEAFRQKQEAGFKVKQQDIQQGQRLRDEKISRLQELERSKDTLIFERNKFQAAKEAAEAPEKEAKDKHQAAWDEEKARRQKQKEAENAAVAFNELDVNQDGIVDTPEIMRHSEFDIDSDGTVSEEEAKEYLEESDRVALNVFVEKIWPNIKEIYKAPQSEQAADDGAEEAPPPEGEAKEEERDPLEEKDEGEGKLRPPLNLDDDIAEGRFDKERGEDDDEEDEEEEDDYLNEEDEYIDEDERYDVDDGDGKKRRGAEKKEDDEDKMPEYSDDVKALIQAADEARRVYDEADKKVRDVENEIDGINKYLELDLGPQQEFSALKGQCFEYTDREYTYKFCPFEKTSQKPKGGGIETNLGNWGHWYGPEEDKYDAMKYENGQGCWNGPARSCHVNLHCGAENALIGASEPSRCEYQFEFTTPSRCAPPEAPPRPDVHEEL